MKTLVLERIKNKALLAKPSKIKLARHSKNIETLEKLSKDSDWGVRSCVAQNPNCPVNFLERLSEDSNSAIRYWVAENQNCPVNLLEKLSEDSDLGVRYWVTRNANCPTNILENFLKDCMFVVRNAARIALNARKDQKQSIAS